MWVTDQPNSVGYDAQSICFDYRNISVAYTFNSLSNLAGYLAYTRPAHCCNPAASRCYFNAGNDGRFSPGISGYFLTEHRLGYPESHFVSVFISKISGSKYPDMILFNFEKRSNARHQTSNCKATWLQSCASICTLVKKCAAAFSAEISVISPRKLLIFIIWKIFSGSSIQKIFYFISKTEALERLCNVCTPFECHLTYIETHALYQDTPRKRQQRLGMALISIPGT